MDNREAITKREDTHYSDTQPRGGTTTTCLCTSVCVEPLKNKSKEKMHDIKGIKKNKKTDIQKALAEPLVSSLNKSR